VDHPFWVWQWGEAIFVAQPGEAYSFIQTELRRRNPGKVIFVLNLTNAPGLFYLPIKSAYKVPAYQAWQTLLAAGALDIVIDDADRAIKRITGGK
jgi:lipoprotein signal peptidase